MTVANDSVEVEVPSSRRVPMTELEPGIVAVLGIGASVVGVFVGVLTANLLFAYMMLCLPVALVLLFGAFVPSKSTSRPVPGKYGIALPVAALILSVVGSLLGIVLGHVSRHIIRAHGGDGGKIALAACVVGYAALFLQIAVVLWLATAVLRA
uniref:DUF4190 domain-containing protein n=1 Tax=Microbacterium proteolyticum TaxID=1572644 RepID=UPI0024167FAF|nr:DUF4190 domain-containing protein [Microbacterium proteolyticum]